MKNFMLWSSLALFSSLLFSSLLFSCENVKEQNEISENKISSPTDLPLAASSVEFLALTEGSEGNSVLANECDCEYRILDVDLPPLAAGNERSIAEIYSYDNCSGGAQCPLFTTYTNSDPTGACLFPFGNCHQDWSDLLVGYESFNCLIDAFSQFYIFDVAAYQSGGNCVGNNPGVPEITIAIRCEKVGSPSCGGTDTNIYRVPVGMLYETGYLAMGGKCGCVPHFLKFENPGDPS